MKTLISSALTLFLLILATNSAFSQKLTLTLEGTRVNKNGDDLLEIYKGESANTYDKVPNAIELKKIVIVVPDNWQQEKLIFKIIPEGGIEVTPTPNGNREIGFSNLGDDVKKVTFRVTKENATILNGNYNFEVRDGEDINPKDFNPFPFPVFSYSFDETKINKSHRILLIDGTPRNNLNRGFSLRKGNKEDYELKHAKALVTGNSLSVFTKNIGLRNLDYIKVSVNGNDYTFNAGVSNLFDSTLELKKSSTNPPQLTSDNDQQIEQDKINQGYFTTTLNNLNTLNELTIEDYQILQRYQSALLDSVKGKRLDPTSLSLASQIVSFTPKYLNITSFPLTIPNNDEVTISTEVKYKGGQSNSVSSGTFKTTGALSVNVGSAVYFTGLKNNNVYTESIVVDGEPNELRAAIDEDDQLSVGVGINSEITYRTGSILRPLVSLGFFVPFEEEITPYLATGGGFAIIDKNVSFSVSGGIAFGKINSINERYRDVDLNTIPNFNELNLIQKVWSSSWYVSIGVGFNLNSSND